MKKFFKSFVLCLVVAVFAVCGFAGCGKKENDVEPQTVTDDVVIYDTFERGDFQSYIERYDVVKKFVDGYKFNADLTIVAESVPVEFELSGRIMLFAHGLQGEFVCHTKSSENVQIDIAGYIKDGKIYGKVAIAENLQGQENGPFDFDGHRIKQQVEMIFGQVQNMINYSEDYIINAYSMLTMAGDREKITNQTTGVVTYKGLLDGVLEVSASFNLYDELVALTMPGYDLPFEDIEEVSILTLTLEAIDHSERIDYPEDLNTYVDMNGK